MKPPDLRRIGDGSLICSCLDSDIGGISNNVGRTLGKQRVISRPCGLLGILGNVDKLPKVAR